MVVLSELIFESLEIFVYAPFAVNELQSSFVLYLTVYKLGKINSACMITVFK